MSLQYDELPDYVQSVVDAMPRNFFSHIRAANSSQYRYILNGDNHEVRLTQKYGIVVRRNPTQLNLRYAEHLPHSEVIARLQSDLQTNKVSRP